MARHFLEDLLGLTFDDCPNELERSKHVLAATVIGIFVGFLFSLLNIATGKFQVLGLIELFCVCVLLGPAAYLAWRGRFLAYAENLVLLASTLVFLALTLYGGIAGTGVFWAYIFPFLAFFLKGQRRGWWFSLSFAAVISVQILLLNDRLAFSHRYEQLYAIQFVLSLLFYTAAAAAFNLVRSRFEEKLRIRVQERTAAATRYLHQLQFQAVHDMLTGLPNRVRLLEILEAEIARARSQGRGLAICNLRLERLFELGNVLGLEGADSLVRQVASHLESMTRERGVLARTRRDEFVIVYPLNEAGLDTLRLQKFIDERQLSLVEQGYTLYIEFTLGLSTYPEHSDDAAALLRKAEQAMLQARKSGSHWSLYDAQQERVFMRHHLLFGRLRDALQQGSLQVHYQPQIDLLTGRVAGVEALMRWLDPVEGWIPPTEFIPVAEESGLIRPLTSWLLARCLQDCAQWDALGLVVDISINLSAVSLNDPDLLEQVEAALHRSGLAAQRVVLEITESCFMRTPERAMAIIRSFHDAGFRQSIDDFGTGFSSLSYLRNLPVDELKIDQGFVRKLLQSAADQSIVSSTIDLAHSFGLTVVAEGIEDQATADWLRSRRCDIGQGFGFARPMPTDQLVALLRQRGTSHSGQETDTCRSST